VLPQSLVSLYVADGVMFHAAMSLSTHVVVVLAEGQNNLELSVTSMKKCVVQSQSMSGHFHVVAVSCYTRLLSALYDVPCIPTMCLLVTTVDVCVSCLQLRGTSE